MAYSLSDFSHVPSTKETLSKDLNLHELPSLEDVKTLARWTPELLELFSKDYESDTSMDRSSALARLAYSGAELGWTDEQIAAVIYDADERWGKYVSRKPSTRDNIMLNLINRAREKHGYVQMGEIDLSRFAKAADPEDPEAAAEPLIYGFQDFINADFKVDWQLDQLLAQGGIGLMTGFPGTGKTQLCIQMAAYLALGKERFLRWDNTGGSRKVMFLSLEMSKAPLNLFMGTIGATYPDKNTLNRNLLVAPFGVALPLDTEPGQRFLHNLLDEYMPDVIFIDSLQKVMSKEMTDELAVKTLFDFLSRTREKYKCSMVIVHHNRKKSNEAQKKDIELSDVYGSYLIGGEVDFVLSLKKTDTIGLLHLDTLKNRLGKEEPGFDVLRDDKLHFGIEFADIKDRFRTEGGLDDE